MMELIKYCFENWGKVLVTSILIQGGLATLIMINNFTQKNVERLFMIFLSIGLPNWASIFLVSVPEILFFIGTGLIWLKIDEGKE